MPVSPFDHPILSGLLGDPETAEAFSVETEIAAMLRFEAALAEAEAAEGLIPTGAAEAIAAALEGFDPNLSALKETTARDGLCVPELVRQIRHAVGKERGEHVHFGATSQDVIDTGLALRLTPLIDLFRGRLDDLDTDLRILRDRFGNEALMGRTRMQDALSIPAARRIESWRLPLERHAKRATEVRRGVAILHFGGPVGTLDKLRKAGRRVGVRMAKQLGLQRTHTSRHSERDGQVALAGWFALVTGSLGKMGADIALMAQNPVGEIRLTGGGGSSAMPHKQNPIAAETLVALARFNATLAAGMQHAMIHENERSGAAWTLEWMLLPQMAMATGTALLTAKRLLGQIERIGPEPQ